MEYTVEIHFLVFDFSLVFNSMLRRVTHVAGRGSSLFIALHMVFHCVTSYELITHAILKQHLYGSCYGILYTMLLIHKNIMYILPKPVICC